MEPRSGTPGERWVDRLVASGPARWTAQAADRGFNALLRSQSPRKKGGARRGQPWLEELHEFAERQQRVLGKGDRLVFRAPRSIDPAVQHVRKLEDGEVCDLSWPSPHQTLLPELQERYDRHAENLQGAARFAAHREPKPVVVLIHGYLTGAYLLEERLWPVRWLYQQGLDVALLVLPLHGVRAIRKRRGAPPFPSTDPRYTNEGFRHLLGDLRDFVAWLLQRGHGAVGVLGMSLGGYATALAATVAAELSFAVPLVPVSCLADFTRDHGRLSGDPELVSQQHQALRAVHQIISPLERSPVLPGDRMAIVAGQNDGVTPYRYAAALAAHFDAPLELWPGGHLLQFGRRRVLRKLLDRWLG